MPTNFKESSTTCWIIVKKKIEDSVNKSHLCTQTSKNRWWHFYLKRGKKDASHHKSPTQENITKFNH